MTGNVKTRIYNRMTGNQGYANLVARRFVLS